MQRVSFLVGLKTYQHPCILKVLRQLFRFHWILFPPPLEMQVEAPPKRGCGWGGGRIPHTHKHKENICVMKTNLLQCLSSIYFVNQWLHVSGMFVAHHQEVYCIHRDADKSLARPGRKQARKHVMDARDFNKIEKRAVIKFPFLQGKAPKKINAILTETLACSLPDRAKDLSAPPVYNNLYVLCCKEGC